MIAQDGADTIGTLSEGVDVPWMPVAEFALQIGPEFLENIAGHIDAGLDAQLGNRVARGPIVRVVRVGNGDRGRVAEELGVVELRSPRIGVRAENLATAEPSRDHPLPVPRRK